MPEYDPNIEPRRLSFGFEKKENFSWVLNNDIKTYHFIATALFLPLLEKMLVVSLKRSFSLLNEPKLKKQVRSLVLQESIHGSEFNRYVNIIKKYRQVHLEPQRFMKTTRWLVGVFSKLSPTFHFALSAAGEHYTAITGVLFLEEPHWFEGIPPEQIALWRWHCIEEIEHKEVAYDVYNYVNGNYFIRILAMLLMTLSFSMTYSSLIIKLMRQDKKKGKFKFLLEAMQFYWGRNGFLRKLIKPYFAYFKLHFHPKQQQSNHLISHWKLFFQTAKKTEMARHLEQTMPPQ